MSFLAIQKAVYERLKSYPALATVGIYDYVVQPGEPESETFDFPYVTIGDNIHDNWDTDTESGFDSTLSISVWSRHKGRKEALTIMDSIRAALHRYELSVPGLNSIFLDCETVAISRNDDDTYHGDMDFRYLSQEVSS